MGKSSGGKAQIALYRMSLHFGICEGPIDELLGLYIGEKAAWDGSLTGEGVAIISKRDLHGGDKKEGGAEGALYFLPGNDTQTTPDVLAKRLGLTATTCPGFRNTAQFWLVGAKPTSGDLTETTQLTSGGGFTAAMALLTNAFADKLAKGFYVAANNPYLKTIWAKVRRMPKGELDSSKRRIGDDANPAHIIFECLRNSDWGAGHPVTKFDLTLWNSVATVLYNESFGLTLAWFRQTKIEDFINEILDHIQGMIYTDHLTGKWVLKLLRADYILSDLPTIGPDNATLENFERKSLGETINEVIVSWTNPANEDSATVGSQDIAGIVSQGTIVSDSRDYYGVRNESLAAKLATRDVTSSGAPIATAQLTIDRTLYNLHPGDCFKLTWPEHNIQTVVFRVATIDYGTPKSRMIKLNVYEDIFGLTAATYVNGTGGDFSDPSETPTPIEKVRIATAPAYVTAQILSLTSPTDLVYPEVVTVILAAHDSLDSIGYELFAQQTIDGVATWVDIGSKGLIGHGVLAADLAAEVTSSVSTFNTLFGPAPEAGQLVFIGNGLETAMELAVLGGSAGAWTLRRGVLDTVPRPWATGSEIWFVPSGTLWTDSSRRSAGEVVQYKLRTRTSLNLLPLASASVESATLSDRPHRPLRPANVQVEGTPFGSCSAAGKSALSVTWSNRSRLMETTQILAWNAASVAAESGQTTTITVLDNARNVLAAIDGITGTSYLLPTSVFGAQTSGIVRVTSKLDGLESLQGHEIAITNIPPPNPLVGSAAGTGTATATLNTDSNLVGSAFGAGSADGTLTAV